MAPDAPGADPAVGEDADRTIKNILVYYAMAAEAAPFIEHLNLSLIDYSSKFPKGSPFVIYSGKQNEVAIEVITPGKSTKHGVDNVGTVPAAVAVYAAISALSPDVIINAGTAGGFKSHGAEIGDVFIISHVANHDRRIPIPGFDAYGIGLIEATHAPSLASALQLKVGKLSSGNSLDATEKDLELLRANDAAVKDMELAGIAWVADVLGVPLLAVKAITDIVDGERVTSEEFLENLHAASDALKKVVPRVVEFVEGKKLSEL